MTKRDYELIARVVAFHYPNDKEHLDARLRLAQEFAVNLAGTNPLFNRAKFIEACMARTLDGLPN